MKYRPLRRTDERRSVLHKQRGLFLMAATNKGIVRWLRFFFHWLYSPLGPWPLLFSFMIILQTVGLLGRVISSSQGFYLNTGQQKHRINTYTHQTSMPVVGSDPTIPNSERAKRVHALDRAATMTESNIILLTEFVHDCKCIMKEHVERLSSDRARKLLNMFPEEQNACD
jgi:hypothetical protein